MFCAVTFKIPPLLFICPVASHWILTHSYVFTQRPTLIRSSTHTLSAYSFVQHTNQSSRTFRDILVDAMLKLQHNARLRMDLAAHDAGSRDAEKPGGTMLGTQVQVLFP